MATYTKNGCPVCGHTGYKNIGAVKDDNAPVSPAPDSKIVSCLNCRLIYINPMPHWSSEDFERLYGQEYFSHMHSEENKKWIDIRKNVNPRLRFELISRHIKATDKKMLEIGAGEFAYMCRYLMDKGWNVTAQEPGLSHREKLKAIGGGLKVEARGVLDLDSNEKYSLIYADSVLEHVPDPVLYYKKLAGLLLPGGVLYTVSPHEYSAYNFIFNLREKSRGQTPHYISPYAEPYHLLGFTRKSLKILAEKSGFELAFYKKLNDYMAFHMLSSRHNPLLKYPLAFVLALSQKIGLGTNAEAIFIKQ